MTISYQTAVSTENFINSIGVNTHLDFPTYANIAVVENSINFLGVKNLRDAPNATGDLGTTGLWQQVANATGVKFDAFLPEGSVARMEGDLTYAATLAQQGILNFIEGGNEEDQAYAVAEGNSLATTAAYQKTVYTIGHANGLSVINMSFGVGWNLSATGDYGTVGNLSAYANYANAHTYPGTGNTPLATIEVLNSDALLAAPGDPVITTEFGYYTDGSSTDPSSVSQSAQAKYILDGLLDAYQQNDAKTYLYELLDEGGTAGDPEANFGLFTSTGVAKPAAVAIHNLTTLLADSGGPFTAGTLGYAVTGLLSTDHSMLMEKSDGSFWLALWNEARVQSATTAGAAITVADHTVTLTLANTASSVEVFDPLTSTGVIETASNIDTISLSLPDHPILVEVIPAAAVPPPPVTVTTTPSATDLSFTLPATPTVTHGTTSALPGIVVSDAWAQNHPGSMAVTLTATTGTLEISNGTAEVTGQLVTVSGSLAQLKSDLATLHYEATALVGVDHVSVAVFNQSGYSVVHTLTINLI
jgi:hypothetical protein